MNINEQTVTVAPQYGPDEIHPLLRCKPTIRRTYCEWFSVWNGATDFNDRLGLLHELLTGEHFWREPREVVWFLLEIANDYEYGHSFSLDRDRGYGSSDKSPEYRRNLALKAQSILCQKFFKSRKHWLWVLEHLDLCDKILWFFLDKDSKPGWMKVRNCPHPNSVNRERFEQVSTLDFVQQFARLGWTFRQLHDYEDIVVDKPIKAYLASRRPQFLEILDWLQELSWFGPQRQLDEVTLKKLEEIALRQELTLPPNSVAFGANKRRPLTIEEAVLGGSDAAIVVLLQRVANAERQRIAVLYEASLGKRDQEERERLVKEKAAQLTVLTAEISALAKA